jgi:Fe2+ or Zn2+ uptake regulation protein
MAQVHHRLPHDHGDPVAEEAAILDRLRAGGGRVTEGRRAIVRALVHGPDHHVTADEVAHLVHVEHPEVHLSTIYRTLDALEALGTLTRVDLGSGRAVYHLTDHVHHHLVCEGCGAVTEVPAEVFASLRAELEDRCGFVLSPVHLSVPGRCAACRRR